VRADDGIVYDLAKVEIKIENVNDNPPVFLPYNKNITIQEEEIVPGCIVTVSVLIITSFLLLEKVLSYFLNCVLQLHLWPLIVKYCEWLQNIHHIVLVHLKYYIYF
jgi:hypothetical protein